MQTLVNSCIRGYQGIAVSLIRRTSTARKHEKYRQAVRKFRRAFSMKTVREDSEAAMQQNSRERRQSFK